ncbi:MAG: hypothetical protein WKG01_29075 [Kofleriaceae bacterium]
MHLVGLLLVGGCFTFDPAEPPSGVPDAATTVDAPAPPGNLGRQQFVDKVHPILTELCAACHSSDRPDDPTTKLQFYRTEPDVAYTTLLELYPDLLGIPAFSPEAPLVTAPVRMGQVGYSAEQLDTIYAWFALERP